MVVGELSAPEAADQADGDEQGEKEGYRCVEGAGEGTERGTSRHVSTVWTEARPRPPRDLHPSVDPGPVAWDHRRRSAGGRPWEGPR
ncbi:hypothetical protein [Ornithinimicrobium kibberense]|uniref:hypothetical protein n=1 Tax=Ornithinimicrobium kibberense TaxID=282060 RepID=UPI00360D27A1